MSQSYTFLPDWAVSLKCYEGVGFGCLIDCRNTKKLSLLLALL
jgi:hypothetical protein